MIVKTVFNDMFFYKLEAKVIQTWRVVLYLYRYFVFIWSTWIEYISKTLRLL